MIPSKTDIEKQKNKLEDLKKHLSEDGRSSQAAMVSMVRSAIRQSWMKSPTKLAYLYSKIEPDMDDTNRRKWKVQCECCKEYFKISEVEIDHRHGNHTFTAPEDFLNYFEKILMVGFDDLSVLCKDKCHATKTLSERLGVDLVTAAAHKQAISIIKTKKDKSWLEERGIKPASNEKNRRQQIVDSILSS